MSLDFSWCLPEGKTLEKNRERSTFRCLRVSSRACVRVCACACMECGDKAHNAHELSIRHGPTAPPQQLVHLSESCRMGWDGPRKHSFLALPFGGQIRSHLVSNGAVKPLLGMMERRR
ncbi:unnamed protein product [Protopolystoma xenopodis]|uniref:Uncharacterized protein n=1 Tax=Protopolystoma xenopodis TaxID=117903 RepID=A0A448WES1_9PLAT|nr:unnamed protein product [Protopolystoma xenopodis]